MSFRLNISETYFWPIVFRYQKDGGGYVEDRWKACFLRKSQAETMRISHDLAAYFSAVQDDPDTTEGRSPESALLDLIVDWADVIDEDKEPLEFDEELLRKMLAQPTFAMQLAQQWNQSVAGMLEGNSEGRRGTGLAAAAQASKNGKGISRPRQSA